MRRTRDQGGRSLVFLGQPITITPFPEDADHQRLVHHEPVTTVSSSDPAVVAVDVDATSGARATAMALGSATLSIAVGAASANVDVDVVVQ